MRRRRRPRARNRIRTIRSVRSIRSARSLTGLLASLIVIATLPGVLGVTPALACTCAPVTVADMTTSGVEATGFVGALIERGPALDQPIADAEWATTPHRFSVERWLLGGPADLDGTRSVEAEAGTEIVVHSSPNSGGDCGLAVAVGERVAILATERSGYTIGNLCTTLPAGVALAEVDPPVAAAGSARFAVLGNFDGALVAYFDDRGRFLGYEGQAQTRVRGADLTWQPSSTACEDGRHAIVELGSVFRTIVVATGEDAIEPTELDQDHGVQHVRCVEPGSATAIEYATNLQIRDLASGEVRPLTERAGGQAAVLASGVAVVEHLDPGERVVLIDDRGDERELATLERRAEDDYRGFAALAPSPDGSELVLLEVDYRGGGFDDVVSTLRIIDPATGEERLSRSIDGESWGAQWVDAGHLGVVFGSDDVSHLEVLDAATLKSVGSVPGWRPRRTTLVDGVLWGLHDGILQRAEVGQAAEAVFALPARTSAPVLVLAEPVERAGDSGATETGRAVSLDEAEPERAAPDEPASDDPVPSAEPASVAPAEDATGRTDRRPASDGGRPRLIAAVVAGLVGGLAASLVLLGRRRGRAASVRS